MTFRNAVDYIQKQIPKIINNVDNETLNKMLELILSSERIFIYGVGRSGLVGKAFAMRLGHLGLNVNVIGETITPPTARGDILIIVSGSGRTISSNRIALAAKKLGANTIVITANKKSPLIKLSTVSLVLFGPQDRERNKFAPLGTLFEDSCLILLDGLIAAMMEKLNETEKTMHSRHGTLG
ncbi:MAG: 6-phospho-3-hexuloisomerase [Thermoplasmata archaeon]